MLSRTGLVLNEQKTSVRNSRLESFDFLGYSFGLRYWKDGVSYLTAWPSKKSLRRLREKVSELLEPWQLLPWTEVRDQLNRLLRGWSQYFSYGSLPKAYGLVNHHVEERVRHFLRRRHKVRQGANRRWPKEENLRSAGGDAAAPATARVSLSGSLSESRMREIRTSGLMSGERKRALPVPRLSSTLPVRAGLKRRAVDWEWSSARAHCAKRRGGERPRKRHPNCYPEKGVVKWVI